MGCRISGMQNPDRRDAEKVELRRRGMLEKADAGKENVGKEGCRK